MNKNLSNNIINMIPIKEEVGMEEEEEKGGRSDSNHNDPD